jgi:pyrimidine-nucleoside phosphorylase/thymidine phosphorylase
MSKKLAGGAEAIVLDVKVGSGAFMKTVGEARALARAMVDIGERHGRRMRAVLSSMERPLGRAVGNALEVKEAVACLRGEGPADVEALTVTLAREVLGASGLEFSPGALREKLKNGEALAKFGSWVAAQGGDVAALGALEIAPGEHVLRAAEDGWLAALGALSLGRAVAQLGGGRKDKDDPIDLGVGLVLHKGLGDALTRGDRLMTLHHRGGRGLPEALATLAGAARISPRPTEIPPLILGTLR